MIFMSISAVVSRTVSTATGVQRNSGFASSGDSASISIPRPTKSEIVTAPYAILMLLLGSAVLWLLAFAVWSFGHAGIYLAPRADGRPG